ncbi:MAG: hypothetical protein CTY28_10210 [Hyphomicrobium sp.]|nr:MAG: hypothetical protein CTY28_10210 [Hyphomicrobium sp.]
MITKLELNEQELQALTSLMDLGVKAAGLQVAAQAAHILNKLTAAVEAAKAEANVINMNKDAA